MISTLSQTVITTEAAGPDGSLSLQDRRREVVIDIPTGNWVSLELLGRSMEFDIRPEDSDGAIDWTNPERETMRVQFFSGVGNADAIASAVVQYVARRHVSISSKYAGPDEKAEALMVLQRIAGAMGLSLPEPAAAAESC